MALLSQLLLTFLILNGIVIYCVSRLTGTGKHHFLHKKSYTQVIHISTFASFLKINYSYQMKRKINLSLSKELYEELLLHIPKLKVNSIQKVIRIFINESLKIHNAKNISIK